MPTMKAVAAVSLAGVGLIVVTVVGCGGSSPASNDGPAGGSPAAAPSLLGVRYSCQADGAPQAASIHGIEAASGLPNAGIGQSIAGSGGTPIFGPANGTTRSLHMAVFEGSSRMALQTHAVDVMGKLRLLGATSMPEGTSAFPVAVDRTGRFLVVGRAPLAPPGLFEVAVYRVDGGGAPQFVSAATVPGDIFVFSLAIAPSGRFVYGHGFGSCCPSLVAFSLNPETGAIQAVPGSPFPQTGSFAMALHPTGRFLYTVEGFSSDSITLSNVDTNSGVPSRVRSFPSGFAFNMTVDPSGRFLYAVGSVGAVSAFAVDQATGALSRLSDAPLAADEAGSSVAVDSSGRYLYVRASSQPHVPTRARVVAYRIDATTGGLSALAGFPSIPAGAGCPWEVTTSP
jgi:6-phosphogluconolactonase (cycloisomerase 2 family)